MKQLDLQKLGLQALNESEKIKTKGGFLPGLVVAGAWALSCYRAYSLIRPNLK